MTINLKLRELEKQGHFIRVGLIGAGQMGRGMISQIQGMSGMKVVAVSDIRVEQARNAYLYAGLKAEDVVETSEIEHAEKAVEQHKVVVTNNFHLVLAMVHVDVIVDATGIPNIGAQIAWKSILNKKHIIMLNVETDVTVGPLLNKMAQAAGVVYTGTAGDEPGTVMELYDFADTLGFDVVAIGKGKNNPLNVEANPESAKEYAESIRANPKMIASFQDGTKTMIEMTAVANATGYVPDQPGMHGPTAKVHELPELMRLKEDGGILNQTHIVEYVNGIAPGVFVVVTSNKQEVHRELEYLKMGSGPNYVLYRPYHLTSLETPLSIAKAYFDHEQTIAPYKGMVAETVAVAKKDLKPGDLLDTIGGFTVYGRIMTFADSQALGALPIGLVHGQIVTKAVKKGEVVQMDGIENPSELFIWELRKLQQQSLLHGNWL